MDKKYKNNFFTVFCTSLLKVLTITIFVAHNSYTSQSLLNLSAQPIAKCILSAEDNTPCTIGNTTLNSKQTVTDFIQTNLLTVPGAIDSVAKWYYLFSKKNKKLNTEYSNILDPNQEFNYTVSIQDLMNAHLMPDIKDLTIFLNNMDIDDVSGLKEFLAKAPSTVDYYFGSTIEGTKLRGIDLIANKIKNVAPLADIPYDQKNGLTIDLNPIDVNTIPPYEQVKNNKEFVQAIARCRIDKKFNTLLYKAIQENNEKAIKNLIDYLNAAKTMYLANEDGVSNQMLLDQWQETNPNS